MISDKVRKVANMLGKYTTDPRVPHEVQEELKQELKELNDERYNRICE